MLHQVWDGAAYRSLQETLISVKLVISSGANDLTLMAFGNQVRLLSKKRSAVSLFLLPVPLHRLTNIISSPLFAGHNCCIVTWD